MQNTDTTNSRITNSGENFDIMNEFECLAFFTLIYLWSPMNKKIRYRMIRYIVVQLLADAPMILDCCHRKSAVSVQVTPLVV